MTTVADIPAAIQNSGGSVAAKGLAILRPSLLVRRHPLAMTAHFEQVLVLTYALPQEVLTPLLPPGLTLDCFGQFGFLAVAMVQTRSMRPQHLPSWFGRDFFLTGYRIFTRYRTSNGRTLRGLRILRSDTDSETMGRWGNRLTHYNYQKVSVDYRRAENALDIKVITHDGAADLCVRADLSSEPNTLPAGSPFPDFRIARRFAGPLPFTFDYEPDTHSIVRIQGVRKDWNPIPVHVDVLENSFLQREPFASASPVLASAFRVADIDYVWKRGVREALNA
jgi:Uncharacterized conserved protein (COG2071)